MTKHSNVIDEILSKLSVEAGEEYHKLHSGKQGFPHSNNRMKFYENKAKQSLATELVRMMEEALGENESNVREDDAKKYTKDQLERLIPIRQRMNYFRAETRTRLTAIIERELK